MVLSKQDIEKEIKATEATVKQLRYSLEINELVLRSLERVLENRKIEKAVHG